MMAKAQFKSVQKLNEHSKIKIGVIYTEWNNDLVVDMLQNCKHTLIESGISEENIVEIEVPGSYELPWGANLLRTSHEKLSGIICLGIVIKGETTHDEHINRAVSTGIMQLNLMKNIPIVFGVLTTLNKQQAKDRIDGTKGNKGHEAAITCLKMIDIQHQILKPKNSIGY